MDFIFNFANWFKSLPASGKLSFFFVIIGVVVAGVLLRTEVQTSGYQYLYTNLSMSDVNEIANKLENMNVKARVQGDAILVPGARVLELRNALASEGLPRGGGTGFEIFDQQNFGATEFEQRVNYIRAVQGELARTISAVDGVEKARVHIVLPEKKLFQEDMVPPKASVAITLMKGRRLSQSQINGIVHMVGTAVEGLTQDNINVIDQNGVVLFQAVGSDGTSLSVKHLNMRKEYETSLAQRLTRMLENVVGSGGVSVSVSANLDFSQVEKTIESYDPESRVAIQESIVTDSSKGSSGAAGGAPGAAANLPGGDGGGSSGTSEESKRSESSTTFTLARTTQKVLEPTGEVQKLSVAVLVDGTYTISEPEAEGEGPTRTYQPRSQEDIQKLEEIVRRAIGFDESRGDSVKVENLQFQRIDTGDVSQDAFVSATNSSRWMQFLLDNGVTAALVLVLGIIFLMLVKLINSYSPPVEVAYANLIGTTAGAAAGALPPGATVQITQRDDEAAKQKAQELAEQTPELNLAKGPDIQFKEASQQSMVVETPATSEEKLRWQAAKIQVEQLISSNTDEAVQVIRSWMAED